MNDDSFSLSSSVEKKFCLEREERKKTVEELNMLPLCLRKKKEDKETKSRPRLVSNECSFFFILSNARITSSRALSLSLLRYFSRNSSGRKEDAFTLVVVE